VDPGKTIVGGNVGDGALVHLRNFGIQDCRGRRHAGGEALKSFLKFLCLLSNTFNLLVLLPFLFFPLVPLFALAFLFFPAFAVYFFLLFVPGLSFTRQLFPGRAVTLLLFTSIHLTRARDLPLYISINRSATYSSR